MLGRKRKRLPITQIITDYQSGMTSVEVGEKYGVSSGTILHRLKEAGVKIRKRGFGGMSRSKSGKIYQEASVRNTWDYHNYPNIASEYQSGMSLEALGEKYGVSSGTISRNLKKAGVKIRKGGGYFPRKQEKFSGTSCR